MQVDNTLVKIPALSIKGAKLSVDVPAPFKITTPSVGHGITIAAKMCAGGCAQAGRLVVPLVCSNSTGPHGHGDKGVCMGCTSCTCACACMCLRLRLLSCFSAPAPAPALPLPLPLSVSLSVSQPLSQRASLTRTRLGPFWDRLGGVGGTVRCRFDLLGRPRR